MKLSARLRKELKTISLRIMSILALVLLTLVCVKLVGFSAPKRNIERVFVENETSEADLVNDGVTTVTVANDGAIVCDSIVQGVRDCDLANGTYTFRVSGKTSAGTAETKDYKVELINYYDDVTYSSNTSLGDTSTEYKMLVVKYHKNLTINSGVTVTATNVSSLTYKKGMYLCVMGTLTNNGTITMTARGTYNLAGENVYLWKNNNDTFEYVPAVGGAGSPAYTGTGNSSANACKGTNGTGRQTGGGAKGAYRLDARNTIGAGGNGTSYSGGAGGGAVIYDVANSASFNVGAASNIGGAGGNAGRYGSGTWLSVALGGTGNTGGNSASNNSSYRNKKGNTGTGGLLILYADTMLNRGTISSNGVNSSTINLSTSQTLNASGGPSGGGSVNIFYNNAFTGRTSLTATGGQYAVGTGAGRYSGGPGGNGTVSINKVSADLNYPEKYVALNIGDTKQFDESKLSYLNKVNAQFLASIGNVTYETLDSNIAVVDGTGKLTALKEGTTKLKITDNNNDMSTFVIIDVVNNVKVDVQEGKNFTVALKQNGTVFTYGLNSNGQLGIGSSENKNTPTKIESLSNVKSIAAGYSHGLALLENGKVYAWGAGTNGQLGDGNNADSNIPVLVDGLSNIVKIDAYKNISVALDKDGKAYVWGQGYSTLPMRVVFSEKVVDISGTLVLTENGRVYSITDTSTPISGLNNIVKISCGEAHNLALGSGGSVFSWGTNTYGECGTATTGSITINTIGVLTDVKNISAGIGISILQRDNGDVYVLGNNASGQIGISSTAKATAPTKITLNDTGKVEVISAGEGTHSGLVLEDGFVWHTGLNTYGELGKNVASQTTFIKTGDKVITTNQDDLIYLDIGEKITLFDILENTYNLKIDLIDDNQDNFDIQLSNTNSVSLANRMITANSYGKTIVTITHTPTGMSKQITISVIMKMDSIVQGFRDLDLADGEYEVLVNDQVYPVELINYRDDVRYSLQSGQTSRTVSLGDSSTEHKTLVVKYHGDLTIDQGVTVTATTVNSLTYKKGMYLCVLGNIYNSGTISMTARGTYDQEGENVYLWHNIDNSYEYVPADGAKGSPAYSGTGYSNANAGKGYSGTGRQTGGGAKGSYRLDGYGTVGAGGNGTSYSGGVGSGAIIYDIVNNSRPNGANGSNVGGAGGNAGRFGSGTWISAALGGTGNTGGISASNNNSYKNLKGNNGTGGLLVLYADTLYNEGSIVSNGVDSSIVNLGTNNKLNASGGPSGGGSINIFANFVNLKGTLNSDGGVYKVGTGTSRYMSGNGGNGTVTINELGSVLNYAEKTISVNVSEHYFVNENKLSYTKLNDIQTEDLVLGDLVYESLDTSIAIVDSTGKITGAAVGKTKIKVTDVTNGYSTYILVNVTRTGLIVPEIKEGNAFTVALKANGTVWTYGLNDKGQLGNGTTVSSNKPVAVIDENENELRNIIHVEADSSSAIAVNKDGEVFVWGEVTSTLGSENKVYATKVEGLTDVSKVAIFNGNYYVLDSTGNLFAWGKNYDSVTAIPIAVPITDISRDVLLGEDGKVYLVSNTSQSIAYLSNICDVESGEDHYLFVGLDGYVYSIGKNDQGQLGDGTQTNRTVPVMVKTSEGYLENVVSVSAGSKTSMAVTYGGEVYAWGNNANSRLGLTNSSASNTVKTRAEQITVLKDKEGNTIELTDFEIVETGKYQSSISDLDGFVYTVGINTDGELGTEDNVNRTVFTKIGNIGITTRPEFVKVNVGGTKDIAIIPSNSFNLKTDIGYKAELTENATNIKEADIAKIIGVDNSNVTNSKEFIENYRLTGNKIGRNVIVVKTEDSTKNIWVNVVNEESAKVSSKVVNGNGFTVSLKSDGTVWTWGKNNYGQLGLGTTEEQNKPQKIDVPEEIIDVSSGETHTLLLGKSGKVYSFGFNSNGQLGTGNSTTYKAPVDINLNNISKVVATHNTSFAITEDGKVYAWGNGYTKSPKLLEIDKNVIDITQNYYLADDGIVRTINNNMAVMLSLNETDPSELPIIEDDSIVQISEGTDHILMLGESGVVYSYGTNTYGQLGDGTLTSRQSTISTAIKVESGNVLQNVKEVSAGDKYGIAVTTDGKVYTFGINGTQQLGFNNDIDTGGIQESSYALLKEDITNIERVEAGYVHTSVYRSDGNVYTWGEGTDGELGNGTNSSYPEAQLVGKNIIKTDKDELIIEVEETANINAEIDYFNLFGEISSTLQYEVVDNNIALIDMNTGSLMGLSPGRTTVIVSESGKNNIAIVKLLVLDKGTKPENMSRLIEPQVETAGTHTTMLKVDGTVWCYGIGSNGELGNGTTNNSDEPVKALFPAGTIITKIAVGENHNLALDSNGDVWVWGKNQYYQLGNTNTASVVRPTKLTSISNVKDIACGSYTSFMVTEDGDVYGCGLNANGECGIGSFTNKIPLTKAKFISDVIDIKAGKNHTIALKSTGEVYVTGSNLYGEIALGTDTRKVNKFTKVEGLNNVVAIAAGDSNNMVIKADGKVYAWGENIYKEVGVGSTSTYVNTVTQVTALKDIRYIEGGKGYNLAVNGSGEVFEVGLNSSGELGDNTRTNITSYTKLNEINNVLQVSAGNAYTAYVKTDGSVWANGDYTHGDLDIKAKTRSNIPVQVGNDETGLGITEITIPVNGTKNISADCAFAFNLIRLDNNFTDTLSYSSINEDIATVNTGGTVTGVKVGTTRVNAVSSINNRTYSVLVKVVENNTQVAPKVEAGDNYAVVLKADGSLWTFGYNPDGRLAIGNYLTKDIPTKTNILATYTDIKAGENFFIALRSDGKVWSVGNNEYGQLGNNYTVNKAKLAEIQGMSDIVKIAAGDNFGLAMDNLGLVYKWGDGVLKPARINVTNQTIIDIYAGKDQSVFITAKGNVIGQGSILTGEISGIDNAVKVQITDDSLIILTSEGIVYRYQSGSLSQINITGVIDIAADGNNVMYQTSDEKTYVSGINTYGALGTGDSLSVSTPVLTSAHSENTFGIGVGNNNTYILNNAGNLYSSGHNEYGSLGNATRVDNNEHALVGNREFGIKPKSAKMRVGNVENITVTGDPFNVFNSKEIGSEEYTWTVDDPLIVDVEPGKFTAVSEGTAHITVTDKVTGDALEVTRIVVGQEKDRISSITVNNQNAELTTDSTDDNMKYEIKIITNEDTGTLRISTNDLTDRISIDGGTTWSYNGTLNQEITLTDKVTQVPIIVGIKNNVGEYPVEENYVLTITKVTDDVEIKKITVTSTKGDGTEETITATPVSLTRYEVVVEEDTVLSLVDVLANSAYTGVSIDGLDYVLHEQNKYITIGNKLSKEVHIALKSEAENIAEYTLVIYKKNEAMDLSSIRVNDEEAVKISEGVYGITVDSNCDIANIVATATNSLAGVSIANDEYHTQISTKSINIESDNTEIPIKIKLGNDVKEYTLLINRDSEITHEFITLKMDMLMVNGNIIEPEADGLTYIAYLPSAETEAVIRAIPKVNTVHVIIEDNDPEVGDSTRTVQIPDVENSFDVILGDGAGTTQHFTVIIRKAEADTSLKDLYVTKDNSETQATLQSDGTYMVKVPGDYQDVDVTAITGYSLAKVQVNETGNYVVHEDTQNVVLMGDLTVVKVQVQSKDGSLEKEYYLKIYKQSSDANLLKLEVDGTEVQVGADGYYHYYLTDALNNINVKATANDENANVRIENSQYVLHEASKRVDITSKQTSVVIKVKAEDGTIRDYLLIVEGLPDDTTIQKVTVNGADAIYLDGRNRYEIRSDSTSFNVTVTLTDPRASMILGDNPRAIGVDTITVSKTGPETLVTVKVTSQNGLETEEYTIAILEKSNNTNMDMLTVNGRIITPKADGTYYAPIRHAETEISIRAQAEDIYARTQIDGGANISYIDQKIEPVVDGTDVYNYQITITAEDGTISTYYLTVERLEANTNISSVKFGEDEIDLTEVTLRDDGKYYVKVPRISKGYVNVELESEKSTVTVNGVSSEIVEVNLPNETNTIPIIVKAEDGTTKEYILIVEKMSNDTSVKSITGTGVLRTNLNSDYAEIYVDEDMNSVDLDIKLTSLLGELKLEEDEDYEVNTISRTISLSGYNESGVIAAKVNIIAEDGTEIEYMLNIYKEADLSISSVSVNSDILTFDENDERYFKLVANANKPAIVITTNNPLQTIQLINEAGTVVATGTGTLNTTQTLSTADLTTKYIIKIISHNGEEYGYKESNLWIRQRSIETGITYIKVDGLGTTVSGTTYSSTVSGKDKYPVEIKLKDSQARVRVEDSTSNVLINDQVGVLTGELPIPDGETKTFKVIVTSENGESKEYTLTIERISSNYEVESVKVTDYDTDGATIITRNVTVYDSATKTYKIVVNKYLPTSNVEVKAVSGFTNIVLDNLNSGNGTVTMSKALSGLGVNQVTIKLTAADGSVDTRYLQIVQLSDEIGIDELEVDGNVLTPDENGNYEYTVSDENAYATVKATLPIDTSRVSINNQTAGLGQSIVDINKGNNRQLLIPIKVTAEDGTTYTYTLTLNIISHNAEVEYVKVDDTNCVFTGDKYTVYIDKYETEANVEIKSMVEYSTIKHLMESGTEVSNLSVLIYKVDTSDLDTDVFTSTFTVVAEDGTEVEYEIELTRKNDDSTVGGVYANDDELEPLSGHELYDDGTYYVQVVENTAKIKVIANNSFATVSFDGSSATGVLEKIVTLSTTDKVTEVQYTITSQQGTSINNTIYIERVSANNNLDFVKVNYADAEVDEDDENTLVSYIYDTVTSVRVDIKAENEEATVIRTTADGTTYLDGTGTSFKEKGTLTLNVPTPNTIETIYFKIVAENGDESEVYTLNVEKMSTDATLLEIYVDGELIEPDAEGKYRTTLLDTNTTPLIKAVTNNEKAYVRVALGDENLHITEQNVTLSNSRQITIPITVRSQAGPTKVTYLYITKISTSLKLSELTLDGKDANTYDENTDTYRFLVTSENTEFELFALAENDYSILEYDGNAYEASIRTNVSMELDEPGKILKIKQYSESGDSAEHTVEIVRISDNTNLAYLKVNNIERQPDEVDGDTYTVPITKDATSVLIEVQTEYSFANVRLGDNAVIRQHDKGVLLCDDLNEQRIIVPVVVTAADGVAIRTYNIVLIRKGSSIAGRIITQNYEDKHISDVYVYKTYDTREIDDIDNPRELIDTVQTDEDGRYEIELSADEEYDVYIIKDGYLTHIITNIAVEEFKQVELPDVNLKAGDVDGNGEIELDDLVELNDQIGVEVDNENKVFDLNEDGVIDNKDRKILKDNYHAKAETEVWVNPSSLTTSMSTLSTSAMPSGRMLLSRGADSIETTEEIPVIKLERKAEKPDFVYPLDEGFIVTSDYGTRVDPISGSTSFHSGIDLCGPHHGNIYAVADGEVTWAGVQGSYGNCVEIKHVVNGEEVYSFYAHMSRIDVNKGDMVKQGDVIGLEGGDPTTDPNPGRTTGHHLHFEMRSASGWTNNVSPHIYFDF